MQVFIILKKINILDSLILSLHCFANSSPFLLELFYCFLAHQTNCSAAGILMLLPQSEAFALLRQRLECVGVVRSAEVAGMLNHAGLADLHS